MERGTELAQDRTTGPLASLQRAPIGSSLSFGISKGPLVDPGGVYSTDIWCILGLYGSSKNQGHLKWTQNTRSLTQRLPKRSLSIFGNSHMDFREGSWLGFLKDGPTSEVTNCEGVGRSLCQETSLPNRQGGKKLHLSAIPESGLLKPVYRVPSLHGDSKESLGLCLPGLPIQTCMPILMHMTASYGPPRQNKGHKESPSPDITQPTTPQRQPTRAYTEPRS